jgi:hypothetical protein
VFLGKHSYEASKNAIIAFNYHIIGLLRSSSERLGGPGCLALPCLAQDWDADSLKCFCRT